MKKAFHLIILILPFFVNLVGNAQNLPDSIESKYQEIHTNFKEGEIDKLEFLKQTDSLINNFQSQGITMPLSELLKKLSEFQRIAWSSKKYLKYQSRFFYYLMNNADMNGKGGDAIFYGEKFDESQKKQGIVLPLTTAFLKSNFYAGNRNYKRVIQVFESKLNYIDSFKRNVFLVDTSDVGLIHVIEFIAPAIEAYLKTGKEQTAIKYANLSQDIVSRYTAKYGFNFNYIQIAKALANLSQINAFVNNNRFDTTQKLLLSTDSLIEQGKSWGFFQIPMKNSVNEAWMDYYLKVKDLPKAKYYLNLVSKQPQFYPDFETIHNKWEYNYFKAKNDNDSALFYLNRAFEGQEQEITNLSEEFTDLLYAHTSAEFNALQVNNLHKQNRERLIWVIFSLVLSALIITTLVRRYRKERIRSRKQIANLNFITEYKIKQAKIKSTKEAQSKLARELHDNYSASLASIINYLDAISDDAITPPQTQKRLSQLNSHVTSLYNSIRDKSHDLYRKGQVLSATGFIESINEIVSVSLPENKYKREVDLDTEAIDAIPPKYQIEILRIIQEGLTNIIKHANSATEVFLFLFKDPQNVSLQIGDNGKQKKKNVVNKRGALGLKSIQDRVEHFGGKVSINREDGFTLTVTLPYNLQ